MSEVLMKYIRKGGASKLSEAYRYGEQAYIDEKGHAYKGEEEIKEVEHLGPYEDLEDGDEEDKEIYKALKEKYEEIQNANADTEAGRKLVRKGITEEVINGLENQFGGMPLGVSEEDIKIEFTDKNEKLSISIGGVTEEGVEVDFGFWSLKWGDKPGDIDAAIVGVVNQYIDKYNEEKKAGKKATARLVELLEADGNDFVVQSHGIGKFGRCLGELFTEGLGEVSVNQTLIDEGLGEAYFGGAR